MHVLPLLRTGQEVVLFLYGLKTPICCTVARLLFTIYSCSKHCYFCCHFFTATLYVGLPQVLQLLLLFLPLLRRTSLRLPKRRWSEQAIEAGTATAPQSPPGESSACLCRRALAKEKNSFRVGHSFTYDSINTSIRVFIIVNLFL